MNKRMVFLGLIFTEFRSLCSKVNLMSSTSTLIFNILAPFFIRRSCMGERSDESFSFCLFYSDLLHKAIQVLGYSKCVAVVMDRLVAFGYIIVDIYYKSINYLLFPLEIQVGWIIRI